ncbi:hypothetical protein YC2023_056280 [Brassica napus]
MESIDPQVRGLTIPGWNGSTESVSNGERPWLEMVSGSVERWELFITVRSGGGGGTWR